jgi:hypothetical protein
MKLFTQRGINLKTVGVKARGAGPYSNGNRAMSNCDAFVLTANNGGVSYLIKAGATITFYRQPSHEGPESLCLVEDFADKRTFTIYGDKTCKIKDVKPERPPTPLPPSRVLSI